MIATNLNEFKSEISNDEGLCCSGEHLFIFDDFRGEKVCSKCGLVVENHIINYNSGDRFYSTIEKYQKAIHYGLPLNPLMPEIGMSTIIDKKAAMSPELRNAIVWEKRFSWKQRNMLRASFEIKRIGELLGLPQHTKDYSIRLYKKTFDLGLLKGRTINGMVAACVYSACRIQKVPRTLNEIAQKSESDYHKILRSYLILFRTLHLVFPALDPVMLISNALMQLKSSTQQYDSQVLEILKSYNRHYSRTGKDLRGIIAGCIYFIMERNQQKMNQKTVAQVMNTSDVTLRQRLREIRILFIKKKKYQIPCILI